MSCTLSVSVAVPWRRGWPGRQPGLSGTPSWQLLFSSCMPGRTKGWKIISRGNRGLLGLAAPHLLSGNPLQRGCVHDRLNSAAEEMTQNQEKEAPGLDHAGSFDLIPCWDLWSEWSVCLDRD